MLEDLSVLLVAATAVIALNTLTLGVSLAFFLPGERGFYARHGRFGGWLICFAWTAGITTIAVLGVPLIASAVLWWIFALGFLQLTMRQTLKLNVVFALVYWLLLILMVASLHGG